MGDFSSGLNAGLAVRKYNESAPDREMARETNRLGLEHARAGARDKAEFQSLVDNEFFDVGEDGTKTPKKLTPEARLTAYERIGEHALRSGRMTPEQSLRFQSAIDELDNEGTFDAYHEFKRTGDPAAAAAMFSRRGKIKIDPQAGIHASVRKDPVTGDEYTAYMTRGANGEVLTFDPVRAAYETGGRKGFLDQQRHGIEARRIERQEKRDDQRHQETLAALGFKREQAARGGEGDSVFRQKRLAWLAVHPGDEQGALAFAGGKKTLDRGQARLAAERIAASMKDSQTNQPLSAVRRAEEADKIYRNIIGASGDSNPRQNPNPGAGQRNFRNLWGG